eukprot:CAMPEP_0171149380 /NCGR_PEP_ID=MMETSP0766_2-20121228/149037_1 /TAXON_ID=439317 /ORGANISM="Gambierdiscus australes, Strain CAWD 149" /LENGTH=157 /DNA_ID=CAMNT_0011613291 /DNA_START=738 /DNA_END=1211 /DNA_ORIENTATION=-
MSVDPRAKHIHLSTLLVRLETIGAPPDSNWPSWTTASDRFSGVGHMQHAQKPLGLFALVDPQAPAEVYSLPQALLVAQLVNLQKKIFQPPVSLALLGVQVAPSRYPEEERSSLPSSDLWPSPQASSPHGAALQVVKGLLHPQADVATPTQEGSARSS